MSYRRLRKRYIRRYGSAVFITLRDKSGKVMRRASKRATAHFIKQCFRSRCDGLDLLTRRLEKITHQEYE